MCLIGSPSSILRFLASVMSPDTGYPIDDRDQIRREALAELQKAADEGENDD